MIGPVLHPHEAGTRSKGFLGAWGEPDKVLNVGSGLDWRPGWVNMDFYTEADVKHDLTKTPWPFEDGGFEGVWCSHVLEHIPPGSPDPLGGVLREVERVLAPGGRCAILVPYPGTACDLSNLTHYRRFHPNSFDWTLPGSTGSVRYMYGVEGLRLVYRGVQRAFRIGEVNTGWHFPACNLGPKSGLVFILRKVEVY